MIKAEEIRDLTDEDIRARVEEMKEEMFRLRFRTATSELENPMLLRTLRKDIARCETVLRERQTAEAES